jgi:hypothetical protein
LFHDRCGVLTAFGSFRMRWLQVRRKWERWQTVQIVYVPE